MVRGAMAGAAANSIGTEQGLIYGDIYDQTGQTAPGTAALYGLGAGLLDVLPEAGLIGKIAGKQATKGLVREVLGQAGKEAATEGAQTVVERGAVSAVDPSKETFSQEGISDIANSAILGGLGGGVAGAGGKLFAGKPAAVVTDSTSAPAQPAVDPNTGPLGRAAATAQVTGAAQEQQRISALRAAADQAMAGTNAPSGTATDTTSEKASAQQSPSGSFGNLAEFESLLNQERGDLAGRRQALADAQQQDREARLAEIGNAVDYARATESERQRNAVMDQVFSAPETAYASPQQLTQAFSGALAQAGFRDTAPTEREQARMARALDARSAILQSERQAPAAGSFGNLADFESLLNSEQADLGNRRMALQRQQANAPTGLTPEKQTRLADELAAGWKPFGKRGLVSPSGKKHLLSVPELDYLRSLQEQSNGAVPGQTPTEVAAQGDQARGAEPGGSAGNVEPQPAVERGPGAGAGTAVPGVQPDVAVRDVAGWGGVDAKSRIAELQAQRDKHGPLDKESFALAEQLHPLVVKDAQDAIGSGTMPVYETGNGTFIAVHPSAQNAGKIQVTRISGSGVFGDSQYNNLEDVDSSEGLWFRRRLSDKDAEDVFKRAADAEAAYQARRNGGVDATQAQGARPAGVEAAPSVGNEAPGRAQVAQGTAPVQIPAVQNAPTFDFSGKSPDQIAWLSGHGINGWKEAAQAEIARRQAGTPSALPPGTPSAQQIQHGRAAPTKQRLAELLAKMEAGQASNAEIDEYIGLVDAEFSAKRANGKAESGKWFETQDRATAYLDQLGYTKAGSKYEKAGEQRISVQDAGIGRGGVTLEADQYTPEIEDALTRAAEASGRSEKETRRVYRDLVEKRGKEYADNLLHKTIAKHSPQGAPHAPQEQAPASQAEVLNEAPRSAQRLTPKERANGLTNRKVADLSQRVREAGVDDKEIRIWANAQIDAGFNQIIKQDGKLYLANGGGQVLDITQLGGKARVLVRQLIKAEVDRYNLGKDRTYAPQPEQVAGEEKAPAGNKGAAQGVATHQDAGKPEEAATPAVVAESLQKGDANTRLDIRQMRERLLGDIDAAAKTAQSAKPDMEGVRISSKPATYAGVKTWQVDGPENADGLTPRIKIKQGKTGGFRIVFGADSVSAPNLEIAKED